MVPLSCSPDEETASFAGTVVPAEEAVPQADKVTAKTRKPASQFRVRFRIIYLQFV
jgi:hypothetical protein